MSPPGGGRVYATRPEVEKWQIRGPQITRMLRRTHRHHTPLLLYNGVLTDAKKKQPPIKKCT